MTKWILFLALAALPARAADTAVERGLDKAGKAIERGAKTAGRAADRGAKAVQKGAAKVHRKIDDKVRPQ